MKPQTRTAALVRSVRLRRLEAIALALIAVPTLIAIAHHLPFVDVPTSGAVHDAVGAIYGARITTGTTPSTYSPDDPVTRWQMALFMHRGFGRVAQSPVQTYSDLTGSDSDLAVLTINTGGVSGGTGFVKVDAAATAYTLTGAGCPCEVRYDIARDGGGAGTFHYFTILPAPGITDSNESGAATEVFSVPTATTQTFRLKARITSQDGVGAHGIRGFGHLTAIYAPFGSTGSSTLSPDSAGEELQPAARPDGKP